jgi:hypothetical protein
MPSVKELMDVPVSYQSFEEILASRFQSGRSTPNSPTAGRCFPLAENHRLLAEKNQTNRFGFRLSFLESMQDKSFRRP